eukprot:Em0006g429a
MALFGAVGEYVEGEEDWSQYVERLGHFFGANGVSDASKKRSVLLSTIGPKAYQTLASLVAPETPGGKTYDELIKLMAEHFSPKPPVIVQRYRFHSRVRQQGESVSVYVTQLKELARKCEFGDALNDMLRDRLVCGINDERVQKRLLVEVNLTFDSALKISQGCEVAERGEQVLELEPRGVTGVCGGTTLLISAHIEVLSVLGVAKEVISGWRVNKYKRRLGECSHLGEEYRCCKRSQKTLRRKETVSIDGVLVTMELDTGAAVSIVSESTFRRLWSGKVLERICGDFRLTVNQALETERYPLPKIEDILASLAEKVEAVKNAPEPKNITELKSYLGLLTYYSRFLPRMATMLAQLYRLLQAKIPWNWTQKEKMAFENKEEFATVCQDHKQLLQLFDPQRGIPMQVSGRIQRWIMTLAVYKYKLVFKKTEEHGNADALSRLPMDGKQIEEEEEIPTELVLLFESLKDSPVDCSQVKHWTKKDPILSQVLQYILAGWPLHPPSGASQTLLSFWQRRMELSTHDGCILWGNRVVVPEKGRNYVLQELHGGHPGISRMKSLSRTFVWWPGIDKDIEMLVSKCPQCQAARPSPPVAPLQPWSWPTRPWARLHIDYAGPVEGQMLLVVIDAHSKWIEVEVGKDATAEATIQQLRTIFSRRHQDQLRKRTGEADDTWMGDRLSTDVAAEDPELNNGAQDEQEEDANNSVVGDEHEIDEEIDQEARPPVIVQQAPDRRYPSRNRRQPERYQAGFS